MPLTLADKGTRPATAADIPALVTLGVQFLTTSEYAPHCPPDAGAITAMFETVIPRGGVFVAEQDGQVVGMIGLLIAPHLYSGQLVANELFWFVDPEARGTAGLRLLAQAEQWARDQGAVRLHMVAPNGRVGRLYRRRGFRFLEAEFGKALRD